MSIQGNLAATIVKVPLKGRVAFAMDFSPVSVAGMTVSLYVAPDDGSAEADIITHEGTDTKTSSTAVLFELTSPEALLLSAQRLRPFLVTLADEATEEVRYSMTGYLLPVLNLFYGSLAATIMQPTLNSAFVNRVAITAYAGNVSGSLDYITTADKSLGTILEFVLVSGGQPEQWVLEAGTNATDAGVYQRPNDYNGSTNARVWRRCM
jgi:hypothetical protein